MVTGLAGLSPQLAFRLFMEEPDEYLQNFRDSDPLIEKEIEYFRDAVENAETTDDLLNDFRSLRFLLSAFSLEDEAITGVGRVKKVLSEDPTDTSSLAFQLADDRFLEMAETLRFDLESGLDNLKNDVIFQEDIIDRYVRNEFEVALGESSTQLREAAFFARNIEDTDNIFDILGQSVLRNVVLGALSLPEEIAVQSIDTQAATIESRIDLQDFYDSDAYSISDRDVEEAQSDAALIDSNIALIEAAYTETTYIEDELNTALDAYNTLDDDIDTGGTNAADIAVQETAVPELVRYEQVLLEAEDTLEDIDTYFTTLESIISQAKNGEGTFSLLQTEFSDTVDSITNAINNGSVNTLIGTTENLLLSGSDGTQSVQYDSDGSTFSISQYDLTSLIDDLNTAVTSFNAASSGTDVANMATVESRVSFAKEEKDTTLTTVQSDISNLDTTFASKDLYATLNTDDLRQGFRSIRDALDRSAQIDVLLGQIADLAQESADLTSTADRTDLQSSYEDLVSQIRTLVENTNDSGLTNFLDGTATQSYEVINGYTLDVQGGFDLITDIVDVLEAQDILSQSSAEQVRIDAIQSENDTGAANLSLNDDLVLIDTAYTTYDPRGRIDSTVINLADALPLLLDQASVNGVNLLDADQNDLTVTLQTSSFNLTIDAQTTFESDTQTALDNIVSLLGTDLTGAVSALTTLELDVSSTARELNSDANSLNTESAKVGAVLDLAAQQAAEDSENPYSVNEYTLAFIERYLILNGETNATVTGDALIANLLSGESVTSSDTTSEAGIALSLLS